MGLAQNVYRTYVRILEEELVPAFGCTEPIAIAYCAAKAREVLGTVPEKVVIQASGNIIKNVKSVIVPNTDGLKGIPAAAAAGIVGGLAEKKLEVISELNDEQKEQMREYLEKVPFDVKPLTSGDKLDILITVYAGEHQARVRICRTHCNIALIEKDGETLYHEETAVCQEQEPQADRSLLSVKNIIQFAQEVNLEDVREVLDRQISYNYRIAREGMEHNWGANIGSILVKTYGDDVKIRCKALAAAGSDARMGGCELPVVINSGSGNQGITVSMPIVEYAKEVGCSEEKLLRALTLANLLSLHQKRYIGNLSAYCGATSAGCAAACGIAYIDGASVDVIGHTIVNAISTIGGMVCDGAKSSCASKIASAVEAGLMGYELAKRERNFKPGEGMVVDDVEQSIRNIGRMGREGMKSTDVEILNIMLGK